VGCQQQGDMICWSRRQSESGGGKEAAPAKSSRRGFLAILQDLDFNLDLLHILYSKDLDI
jgi:hypothetical protein